MTEIRTDYEDLFYELLRRYGPPEKHLSEYVEDALRSLDVFDVVGFFVALNFGCARAMEGGNVETYRSILLANPVTAIGVQDDDGVDKMIAATFVLYSEMLSFDDYERGVLSSREDIFKVVLENAMNGIMELVAERINEEMKAGRITANTMHLKTLEIESYAKLTLTHAVYETSGGRGLPTDEADIAEKVGMINGLYNNLVENAGEVDDSIKARGDDNFVQIYIFMRIWSFLFTMINVGMTTHDINRWLAQLMSSISISPAFMRDFIVAIDSFSIPGGDDDEDDDDEEDSDGDFEDHIEVRPLVTSRDVGDLMIETGGINMQDLIEEIQARLDEENDQ